MPVWRQSFALVKYLFLVISSKKVASGISFRGFKELGFEGTHHKENPVAFHLIFMAEIW